MSRCVPAVVVCMKACEGKEREVVRERSDTTFDHAQTLKQES